MWQCALTWPLQRIFILDLDRSTYGDHNERGDYTRNITLRRVRCSVLVSVDKLDKAQTPLSQGVDDIEPDCFSQKIQLSC